MQKTATLPLQRPLARSNPNVAAFPPVGAAPCGAYLAGLLARAAALLATTRERIAVAESWRLVVPTE